MARTHPPVGPDPDLDNRLDAAFPSTVGTPFGAAPVSAPPAYSAPDGPRMGVPEGWPMAPTLISRVLADVGPVVKDQVAKAGGSTYNFRGIDQVTSAVHSAFKRHMIFPTSKVTRFELRDTMTTGKEPRPTREATLVVVFTFTAPDGSTVTTEVPGEALDTSDKSTPKAMSVALRIALLQMLLIPTGEPTTDHEYHTRDGVGAMAPTVAEYLLGKLATAPLAEVVGPIRAMISEHSAWDRPARENGATWAAEFADRLSWIIDLAPDMPTISAIHATLEQERLLAAANGAGTMLEQLKARWMVLRETYANTLNHVTGEILKAAGRDELEVAVQCGFAALEAGTLRPEDMDKAFAIAQERSPKLPEVAPVAADPDPDPADESAAPAPLDPTSAASIQEHMDAAEAAHQAAREANWEEARQAFVNAATMAPLAGHGEEPSIGEHAVYVAISNLLTGVEDGTEPAATFGAHGFQLVRDAIATAHRREHSIGDGIRHELDQLLLRTVAAHQAEHGPIPGQE